ncbi:hypothetical protein D9758_010009 [Tetrapyrgos nigripes]|uniref:Uncharacterized protein n=1 Tax=Tetrapyrgos nigripes TaxID=182062 RepID=A0A8H5CVY4_9AGAR|nr:hypothetical protein D9758_010009 [Tetrapyrgos nigripes]
MAASSEPNAASFFQHSHQISVVNSTFNMVAGNMDVAHYRDHERGTRRSSVLSRLFSKISEVIPWSTERSPVVNRCTQRIVSRNNIKLLDQLSSERQYRIHSAKYKQRLVLVKVFQGTQAKKNFKEEKKQNQRLLHPSLLKMIGVSPFTTESPFIVYNFAPARGSVESRLASVLEKDLSDILLLGCKIVSELAIGLDYLSSEGARAGSSSKKSIEIFITDDDVLKIAPDFGSLLIEDGGRHDGSNIDPLWGLFNDLCIKTFKQATCILYPDVRNREVSSTITEVSSAPDPDPATDVLGDTESLTSGVSSNLHFKELEGSPSPRRELLWRESSGGSQSVHAVAEHYREFWEHLNLTVGQSYHSYTMPRKRAARPLRTVVHRCQGYRKEEIMLTSDVSENAIVSHFIPSLYERCPVCKEIVEEEEFRCACGGNDDGITPTIKCSTCGIRQHSSCVHVMIKQVRVTAPTSSSNLNLLFMCSFCIRSPNPRNPNEDASEGTRIHSFNPEVESEEGCTPAEDQEHAPITTNDVTAEREHLIRHLMRIRDLRRNFLEQYNKGHQVEQSAQLPTSESSAAAWLRPSVLLPFTAMEQFREFEARRKLQPLRPANATHLHPPDTATHVSPSS